MGFYHFIKGYSMFKNIFNQVKSLFNNNNTENSQIHVSIPKHEHNTKIEIKISQNHILDEFLEHENVKCSKDLLTAVTTIKNKHLEFQKTLDNLEFGADALQERLTRTNEVDKLVNQAMESLRDFVKVPHAIAVSQILPEHKKNRLEVIIEHCYGIAQCIQRMQTDTKAANSLSLMNNMDLAMGVDKDELDFHQIEVNGPDIYFAKLRSKPEKSLVESNLLLNILKIGVQLRKEVPSLLSSVLTDEQSAILSRGIAANYEYETAMKNNNTENAALAATKLNQELPKIVTIISTLEKRKSNNQSWIEKIDSDKEIMTRFQNELDNTNRAFLFEKHWQTFFSNMDLMSQIRLQLEQNQVLIDENLVILNNIKKNEQAVKNMLGV